MRSMTLSVLLAFGGFAVAIGLAPVGAQAATPLPWSNAYTAIRECVGSVCQTELKVTQDNGYNKDASAFANVPGVGVAFSSTSAGTGALAMPVMQAYTSTGLGYTSTAFVNAVQGYKWTGPVGVDIAFSGIVDYVGAGPGFVTAGLAITDTSVRDPAIGTPWVLAPGDGSFPTNCSSAGTIGRVNLPKMGRFHVSSTVRTVDFGSFGPVRRSSTELRAFHLATVFGLIPCRFARPLRLS